MVNIRFDALSRITLVQELLDMLSDKVPGHDLLGQELGALNALDAQFSATPTGEGLVHLPFA